MDDTVYFFQSKSTLDFLPNLLTPIDTISPVLSNSSIETVQVDNIPKIDSDFISTSIIEKLDHIINYGIGYNDWIGYIAIPLIIALFAFSFPFIFNEVNRINNKYNSFIITEIFRNKMEYKGFFFFNTLCILLLFLYGLNSLILTDKIRIIFFNYSNWILFIFSLLYSIVVLKFVYLCIAFNNPFRLINLISSYIHSNLRKIKFNLKKQYLYKSITRFFSKNAKLKKAYYQASYNFSYQITTSIFEDKVRSILSALVNSYVDTAEISVFSHTINKGMEILNELESQYSNNKKQYSFKFLEDIIKHYVASDSQLEIMDTLFLKLFSIYDKSQLVSEIDLGYTVRCVSYLSKYHFKIYISHYLEISSYSFSFVQNYSRRLYIEGKNQNTIDKAIINSRKNMDMIKNFHYLLLGKIFKDNNYEVFRYFSNVDKNMSYVFPLNNVEVLYTFVRTSELIDKEGKFFKAYELKWLFLEEINIHEILKELTVIMLFLTSSSSHYNPLILNMDFLRMMTKKRKELTEAFIKISKNKELIEVFPSLKDCDFDLLFNLCIINACFIHKGIIPPPSIKNANIQKTSFLLKDIQEKLFNLVIEPENYRLLENTFIEHFSNFNSNLKEELKKYFRINIKTSNSNKIIDINPINFKISSKIIENQDILFNVLFNIRTVINEKLKSRILYATLEILRGYSICYKNVSADNINSFLESKIKGDPKKYIMIDNFSPYTNFMYGNICTKTLPLDTIPTFKVERLLQIRGLENLNIVNFFKECLILVKKEDMPVIAGLDQAVGIEFTQEVKEFFIKIEIVPGLKLLYKESGKIIVIRMPPKKITSKLF